MVDFVDQYWLLYLKGLGIGLVIAVAAMATSVTLGTLGALGRRSSRRVIRALASTYAAVFRGVPPLVTLYLVYFGLPPWAASNDIPFLADFLQPLNNRIISAVVAFSLTSGAYTTEIIRAAIGAVRTEQIEAARALGMSRLTTFRRVTMPLAVRVALPALGNEFIIVVKGTSLASVIGVVEVMRTAQIAASATFQNLLAYSLAGVYYVAVVIVLQLVLARVESRLRMRSPSPLPARGWVPWRRSRANRVTRQERT